MAQDLSEAFDEAGAGVRGRKRQRRSVAASEEDGVGRGSEGGDRGDRRCQTEEGVEDGKVDEGEEDG